MLICINKSKEACLNSPEIEMFGFMVSRSHGLMFIKLPALFNFAVGVEALREEAFVEDNWSQ